VGSIERAWEACLRGDITTTGVMVHLAVPEMDAGPVLAKSEVVINISGTVQELEAQMHAIEHRLLVQVIGQIAEGRG
jgi:folate-dependent phosphoribosylglycinamide formyltransferase PurN